MNSKHKDVLSHTVTLEGRTNKGDRGRGRTNKRDRGRGRNKEIKKQTRTAIVLNYSFGLCPSLRC
jgi:hypothetical protein